MVQTKLHQVVPLGFVNYISVNSFAQSFLLQFIPQVWANRCSPVIFDISGMVNTVKLDLLNLRAFSSCAKVSSTKVCPVTLQYLRKSHCKSTYVTHVHDRLVRVYDSLVKRLRGLRRIIVILWVHFWNITRKCTRNSKLNPNKQNSETKIFQFALQTSVFMKNSYQPGSALWPL